MTLISINVEFEFELDGSIQLTGGTSTSGLLEVYHNGEWGSVCDDYFDNNSASVVCKQLKISGNAYNIKNTYGTGQGPIWLDNVLCKGEESTLSKCSHNGWGTHDCLRNQDVAVQCGNLLSYALQCLSIYQQVLINAFLYYNTNTIQYKMCLLFSCNDFTKSH